MSTSCCCRLLSSKMTTALFNCCLLLLLLRMMIIYPLFCVMNYDNLSMYAHETLNLPVPSELIGHLEMMKVCQHCPHLPLRLSFTFAFAAAINLWIQSIRHLCETLCTIPGTKSAAPLLNYACRTGNNALLVFCLQMQGTVLQVIQGV
jgi:hypothetical protein